MVLTRAAARGNADLCQQELAMLARAETLAIESVTYNAVRYINTAPHAVTLQSPEGEVISVPACGTILSATPQERSVPASIPGVDLVHAWFEGSPHGRDFLAQLEAKFHGEPVIVIGSIIAAQAYPGQVMAMVPVPGFERVAPPDKRMRTDKFTIFPDAD